MPTYHWGLTRTPYSPRPDLVGAYRKSNWKKLLETPSIKLRLIDEARSQEVDDFYKVCSDCWTFDMLLYIFQRTQVFKFDTPYNSSTRAVMTWRVGSDQWQLHQSKKLEPSHCFHARKQLNTLVHMHMVSNNQGSMFLSNFLR